MNEQATLINYYENLRNEIWERLHTDEEGSTREQTFTQYALDLLAEAGEVENARECYEESPEKSRNQHKINGYSLSESLETVQLFYTIYKGTDELSKTYKPDIDSAVTKSTRFLKNALNRYFEDMEPTAAAFDFSRELGKHGDELERAEIFILTDGECDVEKPKDQQLRDVLVMYRIIDVRYLMRLERGQHEPIEIDFEELCGQPIPCLIVPASNNDYQSYLAVVPGTILADVYKRYGARLLEMNVRSFLQFTGKVNKGIRETIQKEPHMFLAFNNGIAATAEEVELIDLPGIGKAIKSIRELQIVNGGQTTASILHTRQKDKADVEQVFVQMKLSVIKDRENISSIVNRISRYANSQNKVSDADLTANSPFHIEMERLSRVIWAPPQIGSNHQTRWFYERARGQYKNALAKEITKKQKATFLSQNPKSQVLVKEDLAKYMNLWAMQPHFVVRGNQKNYVAFMTSLRKKDLKPDNVYFEDLIAKAVLFRAAEKIYGVKPNSIGDMRYITVPYSIAYLNLVCNEQLDLYKIWKQQRISDRLAKLLYSLMVEIERFIKAKAPGSLYGEWAKKEECWQVISKQKFTIDLTSIASDLVTSLVTSDIRSNRAKLTDDDALKINNQALTDWLKGIPVFIWDKIDNWGRLSGNLSIYQRSFAQSIALAIKTGRAFRDNELKYGSELIEKVMTEAPELLDDQAYIEAQISSITNEEPGPVITLDIVNKILTWDRRHKKLKPHHYLFMKKIADGYEPLSEQNVKLVQLNLKRLAAYGFNINQ